MSKMTHNLIALRFWVRVWRLSHLSDCSSLNMDGPPKLPSCSNSGIRAPVQRRVRPRKAVRLRRKQQRWYKRVGPFAEKPTTTIQASKSFRLRGGAWWIYFRSRGSM